MTSPSDTIRSAALEEAANVAASVRDWTVEDGYRDALQMRDVIVASIRALALSAGEPVAWQPDRLLALLRQHHDWHLQSGTIGLPDGDGGWIEINNALEYGDSRMCEETQAALEGQPAPDLEPMPRGGINTWWWQVAVLQRREIRALKAQIAAAPTTDQVRSVPND